MNTKVRLALVQISPKMGDVRANFAKVFEKIRIAKKASADLVIFPELATAGYLSQGSFLEAGEKSSPYMRKLLSETKGIGLILGFVEENELGFLYNSALAIDQGKLSPGKAGDVFQKHYRKCYLPTYGMFEDKRWFAPGDRVPVFTFHARNAGSFTVATIICEDLWHPLPARIGSMRGAQLIAVLSASPKTLTKPDVVDALLKARAIENANYVAFANQAGSQDMVNFWGGSKIVSPEGQVLAEGKLREEDLVVADIDLYKLRKYRQLNPMLRDERKEMIEDYMRAYEEMRSH